MTPSKYLLAASILLCLAGCAAKPEPSESATPANNTSAKPATEHTDIGSVAAKSSDNSATSAQPSEPRPQLPVSAQQTFDKAKQQLLDGQYQSAGQAFAALAGQHPEFAGIWYNLALAQWKQQQPQSAVQSLQQAVNVAPSNPDSHNLLGVIARTQGELLSAERHFLQAVQLDASFAAAHKNLAFLYELYLGLPAKAQYHYQQYFAISGDEQTLLWLALLEQKLAQQEAVND